MIFALLGAVVVVLAGGAPTRAATSFEGLNRALTDGVVIPAYQRFAVATAALEPALGAFCAAPTPASLAAARQAFATAMDGWQQAQPIVFGPARSSGAASAVQLVPYGRDAITRQVNQAVAAMDPALVAPGGLAGKSIALTGFPALERLLYDDDLPVKTPTPEAEYACALALAVARNLAGISAGILDEWQRPGGFRETVLTAAAGNDVYYDAEEVAADLLQSLHAALDVAIAVKLERALGHSLESARPTRLESWRSQLSLANLRSNLTTAEALYAADGGFGEVLVASPGGAALDQAIRQRLAHVVALLDSIEGPLAVAIRQPAERPKVEQLLAELRALRRSLRNELAPAIGLVIGFNATDGD